MDLGLILISLGALLLCGLAVDALGRLARMPRITLLVLFGLAVGPSGLDALPLDAVGWHAVVAKIALTMIAFLLGGELSRTAMRLHGRAILSLSLSVTLLSLPIIAGGLLAFGASLAMALLLAGVGLATDPAATQDVIGETRSDGPLTKTLLGVVAIDDAWGVVIFSILLSVVAASGGGFLEGLGVGLAELFGAVAVGFAIGLPASYATGRIQPGQPTMVEALGVVLLCAGVSIWLEVSFLLAGMTAGALVVNLARHHDYPFHEIKRISWPFLTIFFVLAGATVDADSLSEAGLLGCAFVFLRLLARAAGGWVGGRLCGLGGRGGLRAGLALTPEAGVALGMALVAGEALPEIADEILAITIATTVFFELAGPIATRIMLLRSGEAGRADAGPSEG